MATHATLLCWLLAPGSCLSRSWMDGPPDRGTASHTTRWIPQVLQPQSVDYRRGVAWRDTGLSGVGPLVSRFRLTQWTVNCGSHIRPLSRMRGNAEISPETPRVDPRVGRPRSALESSLLLARLAACSLAVNLALGKYGTIPAILAAPNPHEGPDCSRVRVPR